MATRKTSPPNRAQGRQAGQGKRRNLAWLMLALAIPILIGLIFIAMPKSTKAPAAGPTFTKQGELQFLSGTDGQLIKKIDIEIKQDDYGRQQGMMWRRSMEENQGMLFIMERAEPQTFWMLNTFVSLDILFVDEQFRIVNIRERAEPQSLGPQSSTGPALYVVEVVAGFCEKHGIKAGDMIRFEPL